MHPPAEPAPRTTPGDGSFARPRPTRLDPLHPRHAEILAAHDQAVRAGQPGYPDPDTGLFVLTSAYLFDRGTCCDRGCRHCPYDAPGSEPPASGGGS